MNAQESMGLSQCVHSSVGPPCLKRRSGDTGEEEKHVGGKEKKENLETDEGNFRKELKNRGGCTYKKPLPPGAAGRLVISGPNYTKGSDEVGEGEIN